VFRNPHLFDGVFFEVELRSCRPPTDDENADHAVITRSAALLDGFTPRV
jgi:hypothetical protein